MTARRFALALLAVDALATLLGAAQRGLGGDDAGSGREQSAGAIQFRRIYAPEARIADWPADGGPYLPIDTEEFEQLVSKAQSPGGGGAQLETARLEDAQYTAQLVGDDVLIGNARLRIVHRSQVACLLPLQPWGLAISQAHWSGEPRSRAILGLRASGQFAVLVNNSDDLELGWSLRGERNASGAASFRFELPACMASRLVVDLPFGLAVAADQGVVTQLDGAVDGFRRWQIALGGEHRFELRVAAENSAIEARALSVLRQATTYELATRGIDVTTQLRLDIHNEPLRRITVRLDKPLKLAAVRYGEMEVPWSVTTDSDDQSTRAVLDLPEPLVGSGRVLRLSALAPMPSSRRFRLPGIRPEGMFWQEGSATLIVPEPLVLEDVRGIDCEQSKVAVLPAPLQGEALEFQYYRPEAAVEVAVAQSRSRVKVDSGTQLELMPGEIIGRSTVELSLRQGERFIVRADVGPSWRLENLELQATENPAQWSIDERQDGPPRLTIRLAKSVSPKHPVWVTITGRRRIAVGTPLAAEDLRMLRFRQASPGRQLVAVRAADAFDVRLGGIENWLRLDPQRLSATDLQLFSEIPRGVLFAIDPVAAGPDVTLVDRKPNYAADIQVDAAVQGQSLTETCVLRCVPEGSSVDRLIVHFSQAVDEPCRWSQAGGSSSPLAVHKLSPAEQIAVGAGEDGEAWEINLRTPRSTPFEIRGVRTIEFSSRQSIPLASLPEAMTQRGTVTIRALGDTGLAITNRLTPIPAELLGAEYFQTVRGAYRYEPARDGFSAEPMLSIAPTKPSPETSGAWVWNSHLDSRYSGDVAVHWASYEIETSGRQQLHVQMPAGAAVRMVWVDQAQLPQGLVENVGNDFSIDLPAGRRRATVSIYFATSDVLGKMTRWTEPPLPSVDVPVLAQGWTIWLPAGFEVIDSDPRLRTDDSAPPSWRDRLFGAWASSGRQHTLDLVRPEHWLEFVGRSPAQQRAGETVAALLKAIGVSLVANDANQKESLELTWEQLLTASEQLDDGPRIKLLLDGPALARAGLSPNSIVPPISAITQLERARQLLLKTRLMLLARGDSVLLTTSAAAALYHKHLAPSEESTSRFILPGPLADQMDRSLESPGTARFLSLESWLAEPDQAFASGNIPGWPDSSLTESPAWTAASFAVLNDGASGVWIIRTAAMRLLSWATFLTVFALGAWQAGKHLAAWLLFIGVLQAVALLIPPAYMPLSSAMFLGAVAAAGWHLTDRSVATKVAGPTSRSSLRLARAAQGTAVLVAGYVVATVSAGYAADPVAVQTNTTKHQDPIYKVFVPIDDAQRPTGGRYHLPAALYNELHRRSAEVTEQPTGWLLTRAVYRGTLSRDTVRRKLVVGELKAILDLQVFQRNVTVHLPLGQEGSGILRDGAKLDGEAIAVESKSNGLTLVVVEAGVHRLELPLDPPSAAGGDSGGFDLTIPPLPTSLLELIVPVDAPRIELPGALGKVDQPPQRGPIVADLGAARHLIVRWAEGDGPDGAAPSLDVDELLWLKVKPGSMVIDAKFKLRSTRSRIRQLRLLADPRLRLLPSAGEDPTVANVRMLPGDPATIDIDLAESTSDQVTVNLSFLVSGASGVGKLRLPRLEAAPARSGKRWLAVSIDPALVAEEPSGEEIKPVPVPEFSAAWGAANPKPQLAYSVARGEPGWTLATQPRGDDTKVEQVLSLGVGREFALVAYDALLTTTSGYHFQIRIAAPPMLEVDNISVVEDGVQRVARWSRDSAGVLTVFLTGPIAGQQRLTLQGRLPIPDNLLLQAPVLRIAGAKTAKSQIQIFRKPAMLVDVDQLAAAESLDPSAVEDSPADIGSFVGCYLETEPQAAISLKLAPNVPETTSEQVTLLRREGDTWVAELDYQVNVSQGALDSLRFDIPPQWIAPLQLDRPESFEVVNVPGESRRQLVIRPTMPIQQRYRVRVSGRVAPAVSERLRVPEIKALGPGQGVRFVVLPAQLELQPIVWETQGLRPVELPRSLQAVPLAPETLNAYEVVGERFQATLKSVERQKAVPHVRLADIAVTWQVDRRCIGSAAFDVEPAGSGNCQLQLPDRYQLVQVRVAGLPATAVPSGENRWRLALGSQQLPQRIEVIFAGVLSGSRSDFQSFEAPMLVDLVADRTLWSVQGPAQFGVAMPVDSQWIATAAQHELQRCRSALEMLEVPPDIIAEQAPEELVRWARPWSQNWLESRAKLQWLKSMAQPNEVSEDEIHQLDERVEHLAIEFPDRQLNRRYVVNSTLRQEDAIRCAIPGNATSFTLRYPEARSADFWSRMIWSVIAIGLAALAFALARGLQWPTYSLTAMMIGAGLAWWLLLSPPAIGILLIGAGMLIRMRGNLRPLRSAFSSF